MRIPALAFLLAIAACGRSNGCAPKPKAASEESAPALVAPTASGSSVGVTSPSKTDAIEIVFAGDGTLVAHNRATLLLRTHDGSIKRVPIPAEVSVSANPSSSGVLFTGRSSSTLLATPTAEVLFAGEAQGPIGVTTALETPARDALLLQHGRTLLRLALPARLSGGIEEITFLAHESRVNVDAIASASESRESLLYDADTGVLLGPGIPLSRSQMRVDGAHLGDVAWRLTEHQISQVDLKSGRVVKTALVPCGKDQVLSNPTPSPSRQFVLVTCGYDGLVLDGETLAVRRRLPHVVPGCDNDLALGGKILGDNATLVLEGCGGTAKLDLRRGLYVCGDNPGVLGAPYEDLEGPTAPALPSGRKSVPRCSPPEDSQTSYGRDIGTTGTWTIEYGIRGATLPRLVSKGATVDLEEGVVTVEMAPDEGSIAYLRGGTVVVRDLPSGAIRATLALDRP